MRENHIAFILVNFKHALISIEGFLVVSVSLLLCLTQVAKAAILKNVGRSLSAIYLSLFDKRRATNARTSPLLFVLYVCMHTHTCTYVCKQAIVWRKF